MTSDEPILHKIIIFTVIIRNFTWDRSGDKMFIVLGTKDPILH